MKQPIRMDGLAWRRSNAFGNFLEAHNRLDLHPAGLEPATLEVTELIQNRLVQRRSCERSPRWAESKIRPLRLAYGFRPARVAILRCTVVTPAGIDQITIGLGRCRMNLCEQITS